MSKKRINELKNILNEHNVQYYVYDDPAISDNEYDQLLRELENLEEKYPNLITTDSPTQRVGGTPLKEFGTITHSIPMLSLSNAMDEEELIEFNKRMLKTLNLNKDIEYIGEPKLDGLAVELVYIDGLFIHGSTRGDGATGEDISNNLKPYFLTIDDDTPSFLTPTCMSTPESLKFNA